MKLHSPLILLLIVATMAVANLPVVQLQNFGHWTAKELRGYEKPLHDKVSGPHKNSGIGLANYGSSTVGISHREAPGIAEVHSHMDDYFVVQSGAATLIVGGEVVNPKPEKDPREIRGEAIQGGEKKTLLPGDVVHIPAKMPHQLIVETGKKFTYFVIKVKVE
jgi:mannose-6-phosphate isomerase-like protein (cupin superfamily)